MIKVTYLFIWGGIHNKAYIIADGNINFRSKLSESMKQVSEDNDEAEKEEVDEEEEEGEEGGKGDNSAAKTPVSLLQV